MAAVGSSNRENISGTFTTAYRALGLFGLGAPASAFFVPGRRVLRDRGDLRTSLFSLFRLTSSKCLRRLLVTRFTAESSMIRVPAQIN
jgi:hypothetical protein